MKNNIKDQIIIEIEEQVKELLKKTDELLKNVEEVNELTKKRVDNVIKFNEMHKSNRCNHIWFTSAYGHEIDDKDFYIHRTCVKCHQEKLLNNTINYTCNLKTISGIETTIENDSEYVNAVYQRIIERNPNITDEKAAIFLEKAIQSNEHLNQNNITEKENIARRLKIDANKINRYIGYGE